MFKTLSPVSVIITEKLSPAPKTEPTPAAPQNGAQGNETKTPEIGPEEKVPQNPPTTLPNEPAASSPSAPSAAAPNSARATSVSGPQDQALIPLAQPSR